MFFGSATQAQIYDDVTLEQARDRISEGLAQTIDDMLAVMSDEERAQIGPVTLDLPLRSPVAVGQRCMLGFFADVRARRIVVPIENWLFWSDYLILQSWFESQECAPENLLSYYLLMRDGALDSVPFEAFELPKSGVLRDGFTSETSLHMLASVGEFILAHELGHLFHNHRPLGPGDAAIQQEQTADAFAMTVMARKGRTVAAMAFYFMIASFNEMSSAGAVSTHPLSSERLVAVAERIRADPAAFLADNADREREVPMQLSMADSIAGLADLLTDEALLPFIVQSVTAMFPVSGFSTACPMK